MKEAIVVAGGDSERKFQLASKLNSDNYRVTICQSLVDLNKTTEEGKTHAILLLYPDASEFIDEFFASKIISGTTGKVPVVLISSSSAENSRARSLRYKADEFLIEPISPCEIMNLLNSSFGSLFRTESRDILAIGDLALDRTSMTATLRGVKLPLYPIQVRILELLMLNPGRAFTRQEISDGIWSEVRSIDDRTVDVSIGRVRDALRHKVSVDPIRTVRSVGYAFDEHFGQSKSLPRKGRIMKKAR